MSGRDTHKLPHCSPPMGSTHSSGTCPWYVDVGASFIPQTVCKDCSLHWVQQLFCCPMESCGGIVLSMCTHPLRGPFGSGLNRPQHKTCASRANFMHSKACNGHAHGHNTCTWA